MLDQKTKDHYDNTEQASQKQKIDELIGENNNDYIDPREAGLEEMSDGYWYDGYDCGNFYVETSELNQKSRKKGKPGDNFYWLSLKSVLFGGLYIILFTAALLLIYALLDYYIWDDVAEAIWMKEHSYYFIAGAILIFVLMFLFDMIFIPYHFDRKYDRTKKVVAEIWHINVESEWNPMTFGEASRYFPESMRISRGSIYIYESNKEIRPTVQKHLNYLVTDESLKRHERDHLFFLRLPFTAKKYQLFKKLTKIDPDLQYEIVYYQKSRVIKEFHLLPEKEYPPQVAEIIDCINHMYP